MKKIKAVISLLGTSALLFSWQNSDPEEIKIGGQTWSAKNLDVSAFRNGDPIRKAMSFEEWRKAADEREPAWCYYDNDPANGKKYGRLYNWYAVNDPRGLAPEGWHIPSDAEWTQLTDFLGSEELAGNKMKSATGWDDYDSINGNGTNENGFSGLPGGYRVYLGSFYSIGRYGLFWSSTEYSFSNAWHRLLSYHSARCRRFNVYKQYGLSVRCLKD